MIILMKNSFLPILSTSLFYASREDKHLFLNMEIPNWTILSGNSAYVVSLIDGRRTIGDIATILTDMHHHIEKEKLLDLFQDLKQYGIINDKPKNEVKNCFHHRQLNTIHIKLTDECNLNCKYCYAESSISNKGFFNFEKLKTFTIWMKSETDEKK